MRAGPLVVLSVLVVPAALLAAPSVAGQAVGRVQVVQADPGVRVDVSVDGRARDRHVGVGAVLGPYALTPGRHAVAFVDGSGRRMTTTVTVRPGSSSDVVLHRPAAVSGGPVINVYRTPRAPIGPGKARVLVAHTATVAPADVRVDGVTVFTDIANGEYAQADVPAGTHRVALLPTGRARPALLGPLTVRLAPRTVTMVYAVGRPSSGSMRVITHVARIVGDDTVVPDTIDTGSAGLAAGLPVTGFGRRAG
ncbi:MAG: DUF4397 domain-containing protein [Nocardioidaceae bacterium]